MQTASPFSSGNDFSAFFARRPQVPQQFLCGGPIRLVTDPDPVPPVSALRSLRNGRAEPVRPELRDESRGIFPVAEGSQLHGPRRGAVVGGVLRRGCTCRGLRWRWRRCACLGGGVGRRRDDRWRGGRFRRARHRYHRLAGRWGGCGCRHRRAAGVCCFAKVHGVRAHRRLIRLRGSRLRGRPGTRQQFGHQQHQQYDQYHAAGESCFGLLFQINPSMASV